MTLVTLLIRTPQQQRRSPPAPLLPTPSCPIIQHRFPHCHLSTSLSSVDRASTTPALCFPRSFQHLFTRPVVFETPTSGALNRIYSNPPSHTTASHPTLFRSASKTTIRRSNSLKEPLPPSTTFWNTTSMRLVLETKARSHTTFKITITETATMKASTAEEEFEDDEGGYDDWDGNDDYSN